MELSLQDRVQPVLKAHGDVVYVGTMLPLSNDGARYFVDRVDMSDPGHPERLDQVQVPGELVGVMDEDRLLTRSYQIETFDDLSARACSRRYGPRGRFEWESDYSEEGRCHVLHETLHLVKLDGGKAELLDSYSIDAGYQIGTIAMGAERVFIMRDFWGSNLGALMEVLSTEGDRFEASEVFPPPQWWGSPYVRVLTRGTLALLAQPGSFELLVLDASDLDAIDVQSMTLPGQLADVVVDENGALCALGFGGVFEVDL